MRVLTPRQLFDRIEWEGQAWHADINIGEVPPKLRAAFGRAQTAQLTADEWYDKMSEAVQAELPEEEA